MSTVAKNLKAVVRQAVKEGHKTPEALLVWLRKHHGWAAELTLGTLLTEITLADLIEIGIEMGKA